VTGKLAAASTDPWLQGNQPDLMAPHNFGISPMKPGLPTLLPRLPPVVHPLPGSTWHFRLAHRCRYQQSKD
jgi:hypothetical protein